MSNGNFHNVRGYTHTQTYSIFLSVSDWSFLIAVISLHFPSDYTCHLLYPLVPLILRLVSHNPRNHIMRRFSSCVHGRTRSSGPVKIQSLTKRTDPTSNPDIMRFMKSVPVVINGHEFTQVIGSGCYAIVVKCKNLRYDREFAAKVIPLKGGPNGSIDESSQTEIMNLSQLSHPNIIKLYKWFEHSGLLFLVLELCESGTLKSYVSPNEIISKTVFFNFLSQTVLALKFAHSRQIAHRDIKPANVLIAEGGVRLADFGLSMIVNDLISLDESVGALFYRAPEMFENKPYDPFKADVWALGVTFYVLAVGADPWPTFSIDAMKKAVIGGEYQIPDTVDEEMASVIRLMMTVDPVERPTLADIVARYPLQFVRRTGLKKQAAMRSHVSVSTEVKLGMRAKMLLAPKRLA